MAGRPIRRAREAAKQNPLVGFIDEHKLRPKQMFEAHAPLIHPKIAEKLEKAYKQVVPNILVYFGPKPAGVHDKWDRAKALARKHNAALLWVSEIEKDEDAPFYANVLNQRGRFERITPYTPFTLLHRLGDEIQDFIIANENDGPEKVWDEIQENYLNAVRHELLFGEKSNLSAEEKQMHWKAALQALHKGVDTAAGRMGVLPDSTQSLSDLFAKYLMTGQIAYNPPETKDPKLAAYYKAVKAMLPGAMQRMMSAVVPGAVFTLD
jgi:hypothetical protein